MCMHVPVFVLYVYTCNLHVCSCYLHVCFVFFLSRRFSHAPDRAWALRIRLSSGENACWSRRPPPPARRLPFRHGKRKCRFRPATAIWDQPGPRRRHGRAANLPTRECAAVAASSTSTGSNQLQCPAQTSRRRRACTHQPPPSGTQQHRLRRTST